MNFAISNFLYGFLALAGVFVFQTTLTGIQRKIVARLQLRRGPRWYQQFLDIFKACSKKSITHGWIFDFGVMMALGGIMGTVIFVPMVGFQIFPGSDNVFIITYLLAVGMLGMAMSSVGSGNPWASIGIARALTQMAAYEVPFLIIVFAMIKVYGTSSLTGIAEFQQASGFLSWNIIQMPLGGIVGFIALLGMLGKKPFDTFIAPAEIASGPMVEYSGKQLGMLFILHEFMTFIEVNLFIYLFLGGAPTILGYLAKYIILYTITNLVSNIIPRFKIDQVVMFFYKMPLLLAFIQGIIVIFLGWGVKI